MKTILLSGQWDSGKSFAIFHAAKWLYDQNNSYEKQDLPFDKALYSDRKYVSKESDLRTLFDVNGKKILFYSATDNEECIKKLKEILNQLEVNNISPDILVTSCRRYDDTPYSIMLKEMNWREEVDNLIDKEGNEIIQIPVLRVKYEWDYDGVVKWYNNLTARLLQVVLESLLF